MVTVFELLIVILHAHLIFSKETESDHKRTKRIINGRPLYTHDSYNTHFYVDLVHTPYCMSAQFDHKLGDCEGNDHMCGGALVRPDFVLTACHCMVYEDYYALETWRPLPPIPNTPGEDMPGWIDERFHINSFLFVKTTPKHPLLTLMTIWAGNTSRNSSPQRRHAAAFYPHHLCGARQSREHPELWMYGYEMDIGLVKSCEPFTMNRDVQLAPLPALDSTESLINRIQKESHVCLFVGWGLSLVDGTNMLPQEEQQQWTPELLQHTFRYMQCHSECSRYYCYLCTTHHGPTLSHPKSGDSGSPVLCDGFVVGVHSASREEYEINQTDSVEVSVACVRELLTQNHIDYLRSLNNEVFHWQNGRPVRPRSQPRFVRNFEQHADLHRSTSSRRLLSLIFAVSPVLYVLWNR